VTHWWLPAVPRARVAWVRTGVYLFVIYDMFALVNDVVPHGYAPAALYRPTFFPRLLHLPAPNPVYVHVLQAVLIVATLVAATGRLPRLAGGIVAVGYLDWIFIGMSYGKVDHDHLALLVALAVLPTVGVARHRDPSLSREAGWALQCIQVAVVLSYFLAAVAKLRFAGWDWANGSIFTWAITRRGTSLARPLLHVPWVLTIGQWFLLAAELCSPAILFFRGRTRTAYLVFFLLFHLVTYLAITIHFLPLVICYLAFVPLERLPEAAKGSWRREYQRAGLSSRARLVRSSPGSR
jgi:vitamin K-dependent gamma-carboxylase-like protein